MLAPRLLTILRSQKTLYSSPFVPKGGSTLQTKCEHNTNDQEQIRLVNGPSHCAGRVEVFHQNRWGDVCDDNWDSRRGQVVCRQLECGVVLSAPGNAAFGRGSGFYWLDDVICSGSEAQLTECQARDWGTHNCRIGEEASTVCSGDLPEPDISLSTSSSGSLQLSCTVPPLHKSTTVYFYDGISSDPISSMDLLRPDREAVHTINESPTQNREGYQCQYEVSAARTAQVFQSPRSSKVRIDIGSTESSTAPTTERIPLDKGSSQGPSAPTAEGSPMETGSVPMVTVIAASLVAAFVVLVAVAAGLAFFCAKLWISASSVTRTEASNENSYEVKISGGDIVNRLNLKVSGPTSGNRGPIRGSPSVAQQYDHYDVSTVGDGPGMPHVYEKIDLVSHQPGRAFPGPVNGTRNQPKEDNGKYETVISNNRASQPDSSQEEASIYQTICVDTLEETVYDTLQPESL